jgi:acyl carrier protein
MPVTEKQVQDGVREMLAEVLAIDVEEIGPTSRFFADLGGESIDLLDLSFRCEKRFGIKVQFDKMFLPGEIQGDAEGRLLPEQAAAVRARFPSLDVDKIRVNAGIEGLQEILTAGVITDFVRQKVEESQG